MLIPNLHSVSALSRLVNLDARTASKRLKQLHIRPAAVLANGRELYDENALQILKAHEGTLRELFAKGHEILYGTPGTISKKIS